MVLVSWAYEMLSSLKTYGIAILGIVAAVFAALFYKSKAKYEGAMRKGIEQQRATEKKATDAMVKGLNREKEARKNAKDAIASRSHFGK